MRVTYPTTKGIYYPFNKEYYKVQLYRVTAVTSIYDNWCTATYHVFDCLNPDVGPRPPNNVCNSHMWTYRAFIYKWPALFGGDPGDGSPRAAVWRGGLIGLRGRPSVRTTLFAAKCKMLGKSFFMGLGVSTNGNRLCRHRRKNVHLSKTRHKCKTVITG